MNVLARRLLKSSGANGLSLVARISEQLLLVPILLTAWSVDLYGEWVLLSALPTYLALSDMGFITAGSNELARRASLEDAAGVHSFYGRYAALCMVYGVAFMGAICLAVWFLPLADLLGLRRISGAEASAAFLLLSAGALLSQNSLALLAGLRVSGRYHQGLLIRAVGAFMRLFMIVCVVIYFDAGPRGVAAVGAFGYMFTFLVEWRVVTRLGLRPVWSMLKQGGETVLPYLLMGLEYMLLPLAQMLVLQGMVILVGTALGAVSVAVFATHRTLTRTVSSLLQMVTNPLTAEVGLLQKAEDLPTLRRVIIAASQITLWISLAVIVGLMVAGQWIFSTWTRGELAFDPLLFLLLLLATLGETIWRTMSAVRLGTNRHRPLAWGNLMLSIVGLFLAWALARNFGLDGVGFAAVAIDVGMCILVIFVTLPLLGLSWSAFMGALARPPLVEIGRLFAVLARGKQR